jgi:hypothetical protein
MTTKWQPGQSGNPGGRPKVPEDLKKSCRRLSMRGMKVLEEIITSKSATTKDSDRIAAVRLVMEYGFGKPTQPIEGKDGAPIQVTILKLTEPEEAS